jgi:hypothetical protein
MNNKQDPIKMTPSFVCYADILGFKELSKEAFSNGKGNELLNKLNKILTEEYDYIRDSADGFNISLFKIKVFSDNIVIGYPLRNEGFNKGENEFGHIMMMMSLLLLSLAKEGFFFRGGLTYGLHYMDENIVFGNAYLEAVEMDKSGGNPGIALSKDVYDKVKQQINFYSNYHDSPQYKNLLQFPDGKIYFNYFENIFGQFPEMGVDLDSAKKHYIMIQNNLEKYTDEPKKLKKYEWLALYHNFVIKEFLEKHQIVHEPPTDEIYASAVEEAQKLSKYLFDINGGSPKRLDDFIADK